MFRELVLVLRLLRVRRMFFVLVYVLFSVVSDDFGDGELELRWSRRRILSAILLNQPPLHRPQEFPTILIEAIFNPSL